LFTAELLLCIIAYFAKLCITFAQQAHQEPEIMPRMLPAKAAMHGQSEQPWNASLVSEIATLIACQLGQS